MAHKAFVFDDDAFRGELRAVLERALRGGNVEELRGFIDGHRDALSDPYEGAPLEDDWEAQIEVPDAHQYGDFALTKYYNPSEDVGVGSDWQRFGELLTDHRVTSQLLLGIPLDGFDPGKQGSYFQTAEMVRDHLRQLDELAAGSPALAEQIAPVRAMFRAAATRGRGLYVTF